MIKIKNKEEIEIMKEGGRILAEILEELKKKSQEGVSTKEIERTGKALIFDYGAEPAFLGYDGFPAVLCTSINEEVVHGVPSDYILKDGDILSLDIGLIYKGFFSDMAFTLPIGEISKKGKQLLGVTQKSLEIGSGQIKPGKTFGDIGCAVQKYIEEQGFGVVRDLCGHGIGRELHEDPQILNYGKAHTGEEIKEGMVFCIEPMVTAGGWQVEKSPNGFGFRTKDGSLSAHFEHTFAVTNSGFEILTKTG